MKLVELMTGQVATNIHLLMVDVQGADYSVLKAILSRTIPLVIQVEDENQSEQEIQAMRVFLRGLGYIYLEYTVNTIAVYVGGGAPRTCHWGLCTTAESDAQSLQSRIVTRDCKMRHGKPVARVTPDKCTPTK